MSYDEDVNERKHRRNNMAGMSKEALKRCRGMTIEDQGTKESFLVRLSVTDPRLNDKELVFYRARAPVDVERVKRAWMTKYRIPRENIREIPRKKTHEEIIEERKKLEAEQRRIEKEMRLRQAAELEEEEKFFSVPESVATDSRLVEKEDELEDHILKEADHPKHLELQPVVEPDIVEQVFETMEEQRDDPKPVEVVKKDAEEFVKPSVELVELVEEPGETVVEPEEVDDDPKKYFQTVKPVEE
jgi:hypothetical protein